MPYVHSLTLEGEPVTLLRFPHDWRDPLHVDLFAAATIEEAETGEENRAPEDDGIRLYVHLSTLAEGAHAQELRTFLAAYSGQRVAIPLHAEAYAAADYADRVRYAPSYLLHYDPDDLSSQTVHRVADGPLTITRATTAPLHVGRLARVEEATLLDERPPYPAAYRLVIDSDAPDAFRILPRETGLSASWPASLNRPADVTESYQLPQTARAYPGRPQKALENQEATFRYVFGFRLTLDSPAIRSLVSFWASRHGPVGRFAAPAYYRPGIATADAPHGSVVRFAEERLRITYQDRDHASAAIELVQLPWEIDTEETYEFPRRVFLYRFTYHTPTPVVAALAAASHPVTLDGVEYLPDFVEADDIDLDLARLASAEITVRSHAIAGNPLLRFFPGPLQAPLTVDVYVCDPSDPDATAQLLYPGEVQTVKPSGRHLAATATLFGGLLQREVADWIAGPDCAAHIYSRACGLSLAAHEKTGSVVSETGSALLVATSAANAADHFRDGWVEAGDGDTFRIREIVSSTPSSGHQTLELEEPLGLPASTAVKFYPGCNGSFNRCCALGHGLSFKGIPRGPRQNPSLNTFDTPGASGKK